MRVDLEGRLKPIEWGATGLEADIQNIEFALGTQSNTLFLDRDFGREMHFDKSMDEAEVLEAGEVATLITSNFENVEIENIEFDYEGTTLIPKIKVVFIDNG